MCKTLSERHSINRKSEQIGKWSQRIKTSKRRRESKPRELFARFTAWVTVQLDGWVSWVWICRRSVRGRNWSISKYTLDSGLSAKWFRWMFWCCASADRWECINENWVFHDINPVHWVVNTVVAPHHTHSLYSGKGEPTFLGGCTFSATPSGCGFYL